MKADYTVICLANFRLFFENLPVSGREKKSVRVTLWFGAYFTHNN